MNVLRFKDRPGCITVADMRSYFEKAIEDTGPILQKRFPLDIVKDEHGKFFHYANRDTDMAWTGFGIGMRCAERLE